MKYYGIYANNQIYTGSGADGQITHDLDGFEYLNPVKGEVLIESDQPVTCLPYNHAYMVRWNGSALAEEVVWTKYNW